MATLSKETLKVLETYPLDENDDRPASHIVPGTDSGDFTAAACWNWALTGGLHDNSGSTTPDAIYTRIIKYNLLSEPIWPTGMGKGLSKTFEDCSAELKLITGNFRSACAKMSEKDDLNARKRNGLIATARRNVMRALAAIAARQNGLKPSKYKTPYTLWVRTRLDEWWSWHHWSLGIEFGNGDISFVQTVNGKDANGALYHACADMWDAGLDGTACIYLEGLHDEQVKLLDSVKAYKEEEQRRGELTSPPSAPR
ncbi:MAG: hypothetical protein ACREHE_17760 [Rhizomicrobium sp.]